jgi:hypothetical protein
MLGQTLPSASGCNYAFSGRGAGYFSKMQHTSCSPGMNDER